MAWKVACGVFAALLLWFGSALVRVENQRYALQTGMCTPVAPSSAPDLQCLEEAETRTAWWWHLYHALLP